MGIVDLYAGQAQLYQFKLEKKFYELSSKDQKTAAYVTNKIHGLRFMDYSGDLSQSRLPTIVKYFADKALKNGSVIGYKGGNIEKKLLDSLGVKNYVNIEVFGTPKFDTIANQQPYKELASRYSKIIVNSGETTCQRHKKSCTIFHCPMEEVCYFAVWLQHNVLKIS